MYFKSSTTVKPSQSCQLKTVLTSQRLLMIEPYVHVIQCTRSFVVSDKASAENAGDTLGPGMQQVYCLMSLSVGITL
jgi:hypothetical protein